MRQPQRACGDHPHRVHDHRRDPIDLRILTKRLRHVRVQNRSGKRSTAKVNSRNVPYPRSWAAAHHMLSPPCETVAAYASRNSRSLACTAWSALVPSCALGCLLTNGRCRPASRGASPGGANL